MTDASRDVRGRGAGAAQDGFRYSLPKTSGGGAICAQFVRCGKPRCRCMTTEYRHGPYSYYFRRVRGRLVKEYIHREDADELRAFCAATRAGRRDHSAAWETWRTLATLVREAERRG